jgi:GAF domain-containing protein
VPVQDEIAPAAPTDPMDLAEVLMSEPLTPAADDEYAEPSRLEISDEGHEVLEPAPAAAEYSEASSEMLEVETAVIAEEPAPSHEVVAPVQEAEPEPTYRGPDFSALADVCTAFGEVQEAEDLSALLGEAARVLDAPGLILWIWDPSADGLRPALAHGYSDRVLAHLPVVGRGADNATAAAFRRGQACSTRGDRHTNGALVVPMRTGGGCAGVLAVELPDGREQEPSVQAAATIVAAMLAQLAGAPAASQPRPDDIDGFDEIETVRQTAGRR